MKFEVITLFPKVIETYTQESIIGRAIKSKLIKIKSVDLRKFGLGPRKNVDGRVYGGGPGMVLRADVLLKAIKSLKPDKKTLIIITAAKGKEFNNVESLKLTKKYKRIIFIAGHYEGIDERLIKVLKDQKLNVAEYSVGDYVLTGGELPSLIMIDAISRKIPGVLGKFESLEEERLGAGVPAYTRPEIFEYKKKKYKVPEVLLSGHHKKIEEWREAKKKS